MFLSFILVVWFIGTPIVANMGAYYFIRPTEPLSSCTRNSSCPPGELCHTMNYLVEHSSKFFSPDHVNVTLIFMCGIHNYTKGLTVQNFKSFVMKGAADSRENVIIDHQFGEQLGTPNCTIIQFFNVSFVNITTLTLKCPAINLEDAFIMVKSSDLYGYTGIKESLSFINVTGKSSKALLHNCTFKENCFIVGNLCNGITVCNSTFQSYKHQFRSIISVLSSVVTITGNVNFTDSIVGLQTSMLSSGTAIFLNTTHQESQSAVNITKGAMVYFINLECNYRGGAINGENGMIYIGGKSRVVFMHNEALTAGGALCLNTGTLTVGAEAYVIFAYNTAHSYVSGALWLINGLLKVDSNASLVFSHNTAHFGGGAVGLANGKFIIDASANLNFSNNSAFMGGAINLENSTIHVGTNKIVFSNNRGLRGGAMYFIYGTMYINPNKSVKFITNHAQDHGGAIYIDSGIHPSIIVGNSAKLFLFNNSAFQGGALYIITSSFTIEVGYQSSIQFISNVAFDVGGAVYSEMQSAAPCMFMVTDYSAGISFVGNYASRNVGHHMYGTSIRAYRCDEERIHMFNKQGKPYCWHLTETGHKAEHINISFQPSLNETLSPVSSAPQRVCLCDSDSKPQCANFSQIFTNVTIYRGEKFTLAAHIVGYDFGTTVGIVHAGFPYSNPVSKLGQSQDNQLVNNSDICTTLEYAVHTKYNTEILLLQTSVLPVPVSVNKEANLSSYKRDISGYIADYTSHDNGCLQEGLLTTPVFVNITLLPGCPPGLTLNHEHTTCTCYPILATNGFKCSIKNKTSFLKWNSSMWINTTFDVSHSIRPGITFNRVCPMFYCKTGNKTINIDSDPSKQCVPNRTGILCGACVKNFSLAIGSSRCIKCSINRNVTLLLAFAAAGVFLVFLILVLNLTVTQGFINGLIFYANILWAYKMIFFSVETQEQENLLLFLQVFVAWLNLDLGIETCFFIGLNAYWKTWLQFLFPLYIWTIAGVIIVACRYSSGLTNLFGSRAVPLLATLFLLSYMKLLRTIADATLVAVITRYPQNTSYAVWYLDGNLDYCHNPHIYLFIVAIATLIFLWLPYTFLLLLSQPLRKVSHLRPLKWINKLTPVYDAYFSPLMDKHQYWFGTMLLVRGILLVILTVTSATSPKLNVFILFLLVACLFFFTSVKNVYKRVTLRVLKSATLLNLTVLSAGTLYKWESTKSKMILLETSIGFVLVQFCVVTVWSSIKLCLTACAGGICREKQTYDDMNNTESDDDIAHERIEDPELEPLITQRENNNYSY